MDPLGLLRRWVPGTRFTEMKRPRRKSTEVKKAWNNTSASHMPSWRGYYLIKHTVNFTL